MKVNYFDIPDEEFFRQQAILEKIRYRHARDLVESGLVDRAIVSTANSNTFNHRRRRPIGEPTDVEVLRKKICFMNSHDVLLVLRDVGVHPSEGSYDIDFVLGPLNQSLARTDPPTCALEIRKRDPGQLGDDMDDFTVGLLLPDDTAEAFGLDTHLPLPGMERDDVALIARQLAEIAVAKQEFNLTTINAGTLHEVTQHHDPMD